MRYADALKLHSGDEVTVKETGAIMQVVETEVSPKEPACNRMAFVNMMLEDGNWYGHKELR